MIIKWECNVIFSRSLATFPIPAHPRFRWHKTLPLHVSTTATRTPEKQLCRTTCITLFCAFLCRQYTISLSEINFTFYGGRKGRRRRTFFSLSEHWCYKLLRSSTTGKFAYVWQREGVGIIKLKFRMTRSHFLNNFFPAVKSGHANRISFKKKIFRYLCALVAQRKYRNENSQGILQKCSRARLNASSGYTYIT